MFKRFMNALAMPALALVALTAIATAGGTAQAQQPSKTAKKTYTIGLIAKSQSNPVFIAAHTGATDAAKELGAKLGSTIKIEWRTPVSEDAQQQAQAIEQLVASGADGIAVSASDAKILKGAIDSAVDKGVHVVTFDSDVPDSKRFAYYGTDDFACGQHLARELGKAMGGKGVVAILAGNQTAPNLQGRKRGVEDTIKKEFKDIQILQTFYHKETPQDAVATVEQAQAANPQISGWAMVGGWPLFTEHALDKVAGKAKVVAVDALPAELVYVRNGQVEVLLGQKVYEWGWESVRMLMDKLVKNEQPKTPIVKAELVPVTKANVDEYAKNWEKWNPKGKQIGNLMATERLVSPQQQQQEAIDQPNWSLRPTRLDEYVGQPDLIGRLRITIRAVRERKEPMEHILLHGPPGLGKTTLAHVIGAEMAARVYVTSGPALSRPTDLVSALTRLEHGDILFIDEIHRLPVSVEEFVYPAMEDFRIDVPVDSGLHARTVQIALKPFCLIGATTRAGLLSAPMRSRFGIVHHLRYYDRAELLAILRRSAGLLGLKVNGQGGKEKGCKGAEDPLATIASRSRGTPRIANRLLRRVRDYAQVKGDGTIVPGIVGEALQLEGVDDLGLDELDRAYLRTISKVFSGGPVGVEACAATMNEDAGTLEDVVEPYLLQTGLLARTRRGRVLTRSAADHLGLPMPAAGDAESGLFE